ncbi:hypothetical protein SCUP234_02020 [Seiridium cupressi]
MDPVSVLGATAASAQILGYAVRGFLSTAKLFQDVKDAPTKVFKLLRHIDKEVALMDRLLHPGSPVFSQLSVSQYAQICPHAVEARRALQDIQRTLQPIGAVLNVPNDGKGTPKRLTRLWKSVVTVKVMNEMESDLKMVERLNASLVRELHVSGLETQALVRDQSGQILAIASASLTSAAETYQSVQHIEALQTRALGSLDASITNVFQGVKYARQDILEHQLALDRSLTSTRNELAVIREDLNRLVQDRDAAMSNQVQTKLPNENITVASHAQGVDEKLVELVRAQSVADRNVFMAYIRNELRLRLISEASDSQIECAEDGTSIFEESFFLFVRAGKVDAMATAPMRYIYDHFNYVEEFPRTAAEYLYDLVLQSKVSHSLFSAINEECGGLADTFPARIESTGIFRLVGQELWKRVMQLKMLALRHLTVEEQKEFGWTLTYGAPNLYQRLAWRTTLPEKFDICTEGSPHCNEILGGRYFADGLEFHQILYDIGFVELDALCAHGRTPLAEFCDRNPITGRSKLWFKVVIWFLENGAEPSFPFENQELAVWPQLQFFVALNIRNIAAMDERICRLELFERMGIAHTCCAEWDLCNEEDSELCFERAELQSEDGVAADQLELLLRRYDLMRKCLRDVSIERFWKTWWEIVDIILPPLLPEEACREPRWLLEGEEYWDDDKVEDIKHQVSQAREERWATMLRNAGYKKWNFKNVIKHHFVGYLKIAQAHKERKGRWRHRKLMAKPRFIVESCKGTSTPAVALRKDLERTKWT